MKEETRQKVREWFRDNALACIVDAESGSVKVKDLPKYKRQQEQRAEDAMRGDYDHTLAFLQRAEFIETGECRALLP